MTGSSTSVAAFIQTNFFYYSYDAVYVYLEIICTSVCEDKLNSKIPTQPFIICCSFFQNHFLFFHNKVLGIFIKVFDWFPFSSIIFWIIYYEICFAKPNMNMFRMLEFAFVEFYLCFMFYCLMIMYNICLEKTFYNESMNNF